MVPKNISNLKKYTYPIRVEGEHGAGDAVGVGQPQHVPELVHHHLNRYI